MLRNGRLLGVTFPLIKEASEIQSACSCLSAGSWNSVFSKEGCFVYETEFEKKNALDILQKKGIVISK